MEKIKKNKTIVILIAIITVGIFLRIYHFSDWLFFQSDQSRDLKLINHAVENGPGWLPLLGPKAGGTFLRLGPVFYYFLYLSGKIFGMDEPWKAALPDLFFSILTIPLFYFFLKEFFSKNWALISTASYAVCFFAVQYSRFVWNPNSLPFFNLLFFYALLKFFDASDKRKIICWTIVAGISYAIASQLHFVCLFSFPIATLIILLSHKMIAKKSVGNFFKYIPIVVFILVLFYVPVILSDMQVGGNNGINFLVSFKSKSSDAEIFELAKKTAFNFSKYFAIIWSGVVDADKKIYKLFLYFILAGLIGGSLLFKKETDTRKKIFVATIFAWFFSYAIVYFPLSSKVQPRHFLPILPLPFIFWGFVVLFANKVKLRYKSFITLPLLFLPIALNVYSIKTWFGELGDSQVRISHPRKSGLLKSVEGEDWWHLKKTAEYMQEDCKGENKKILIIPLKKSYRDLISYSLENVGEKREYSIKLGFLEYYPEDCYYLMYFTKNYSSGYFDEKQEVKKISEKNFGDIGVVHFEIIPQMIDNKGKIENPFRKKDRG